MRRLCWRWRGRRGGYCRAGGCEHAVWLLFEDAEGKEDKLETYLEYRGVDDFVKKERLE